MMITGLHISNFKGISESKIDEMGMVNLFIGKNDSCKSTILEAAYTVLRESYSSGLGSSLSRRTNLEIGNRELWYGYKTDSNIKIELLFENAVLSMVATYEKGQNRINSITNLSAHVGPAARVFARSNTYQDNFAMSASSGHDLSQNMKALGFGNYVMDSRFVDSSLKNDLRLVESLLGQLKLQGLDLEFGKLFSQVFETDPHWEFMPHPDFPTQYRVALSKGDSRVFLNGFGDGLRFCMLLMGRIMLAKNTALFIEEIENNQHPESLVKIVPFLVEYSRKNNLQLFITTHNPLVMRLFEEHCKNDKEKSVLRIYRVTRDKSNGFVQCIPLTEKELADWFTKVDQDLWGWKTEKKE
jgi:AAA15 family ATPase/GTPase